MNAFPTCPYQLVFITVVLLFLADEDSCFEMGYKQFMAEIYGDIVLFKDGKNAKL